MPHQPSLLALALAVVTTAAVGQTQSDDRLATRHGCMGCHAPDYARVGPSFQQIAERYAKQPDALATLTASVRHGSVGRWGEAPMPAETVPEADLRSILRRVLEH